MCCFGDSYSVRSSQKKEYERNLLMTLIEFNTTLARRLTNEKLLNTN
jgi:hypothetical protein